MQQRDFNLQYCSFRTYYSVILHLHILHTTTWLLMITSNFTYSMGNYILLLLQLYLSDKVQNNTTYKVYNQSKFALTQETQKNKYGSVVTRFHAYLHIPILLSYCTDFSLSFFPFIFVCQFFPKKSSPMENETLRMVYSCFLETIPGLLTRWIKLFIQFSSTACTTVNIQPLYSFAFLFRSLEYRMWNYIYDTAKHIKRKLKLCY